MLMRGQRFTELDNAIKVAQEVADIMECNVPIYFKAPYYYHWIGDELIKWVKPTIKDEDAY